MLKIHPGRVLSNLSKLFLSIVPKNNKLILFSSWFAQKYRDNPMYLFEYMLSHSHYRIYWYTKNESLYRDLKEKNIPVVRANSLRAYWLQARAKVLVSSIQFDDFNQFLLKNCIFLDLDHGFPGKPVGINLPSIEDKQNTWFDQCKKGVMFYQTASSKFVADFQIPNYHSSYNNNIFANKPRIDVLFDKELQIGRNLIVSDFKSGRRAIVYMPTHRSSGAVKINIPEVLELDVIQEICERENCVFIIKKHFYHATEYEMLDNFPNIIDITHENIDTQVLLAQADVLVTDFSSCFNDYLALNRPIIFYAYDYDDYLSKERDYFWKYELITAGYTAKSKMEFSDSINKICKDWKDLAHEEGRGKMRNIYFDPEVEMGTSREKISRIIGDIIKGTYVPYDWSKK